MTHDAVTAGQSPFSGLDVERVFSAVELLAERNELEVTPFVASWHPAVNAWDTQSKSAPAFFKKNLQNAILETPKAVDYLAPLAQAARQDALTIAALNYDLTIEQAAQTAGVPCATGVETWLQSGRWHWPDDGIRLLKLHGSIDWSWAETQNRPGHLPQRAIFLEHELEEGHRWSPALVFGQRGKLRAEGPFLGLLGELETLMSGADHLVVIGYSFRDDHVNEIIQRWTSEDNFPLACMSSKTCAQRSCPDCFRCSISCVSSQAWRRPLQGRVVDPADPRRPSCCAPKTHDTIVRAIQPQPSARSSFTCLDTK